MTASNLPLFDPPITAAPSQPKSFPVAETVVDCDTREALSIRADSTRAAQGNLVLGLADGPVRKLSEGIQSLQDFRLANHPVECHSHSLIVEGTGTHLFHAADQGPPDLLLSIEFPPESKGDPVKTRDDFEHGVLAAEPSTKLLGIHLQAPCWSAKTPD